MDYKYIDIHCHLDMCKEQDNVAVRAAKAEVLIIAQGVNPESNRKVLELAEKHENVLAALGIYPIDALAMSDKDIDSEIEFIRKNKDKVSAIGEVGIDHKEDQKHDVNSRVLDAHERLERSRHLENWERQENIFRKFVKLSIDLDIPIIIHSRKAEEKIIEILEDMGCKKVIMHCFCGNKKLEARIIANKWYLTVPTTVTRTQQFQERARDSPLNQLFCETDAPYLHPDKGKEGENEPALVIRAYQEIAKIRNISEKEVIEQIKNNFKALFR